MDAFTASAMDIGVWLRSHREKLGMTQLDVAKRLGVKDPVISYIETGRKFPPAERYRQLAQILEIDPRVFGMVVLEKADPWLFAMMFGEDSVSKDRLAAIPDRIGAKANSSKDRRNIDGNTDDPG